MAGSPGCGPCPDPRQLESIPSAIAAQRLSTLRHSPHKLSVTATFKFDPFSEPLRSLLRADRPMPPFLASQGL